MQYGMPQQAKIARDRQSDLLLVHCECCGARRTDYVLPICVNEDQECPAKLLFVGAARSICVDVFTRETRRFDQHVRATRIDDGGVNDHTFAIFARFNARLEYTRFLSTNSSLIASVASGSIRIGALLFSKEVVQVVYSVCEGRIVQHSATRIRNAVGIKGWI